MGKRHEAIGIKQVLRKEWLQLAANLLLAGMEPKQVRKELHESLANTKGSGSDGLRGNTSRTQVVNMLMKIWVTPDSDISQFRDDSLAYLRKHPSMELAVHWGMVSAAYPFWYSVARQTGRLLALQHQVTHMQVVGRLREQYGDRETVNRYARYVIRSFVAWGALIDSEGKGCYEKDSPLVISDPTLTTLMLEAALLTLPEARSSLGTLMGSPSFFPFQILPMAGGQISQNSDRIGVERYGLDEEMLKLK